MPEVQQKTARGDEGKKRNGSGKEKGRELTQSVRVNSVLEVGILNGADGVIHSHTLHSERKEAVEGIKHRREKESRRGKQQACTLNPKP